MIIDLIIIALIVGALAKTGAKVVSDVSHGVRGTMPPATRERLAAMRGGLPLPARMGLFDVLRSIAGFFHPDKPGFRMYLATVWGDVWTDALDKREHRRQLRGPARPGPARRFVYGWATAGWEAAWEAAEEKFGPDRSASGPDRADRSGPQPSPSGPEPTRSGPDRDDIVDAEVVEEDPRTGPQPDPAGPDGPAPDSTTPEQTAPDGGSPLELTDQPHSTEEFDMSEVTGNTTAIGHTNGRAVALENAAQDEAFSAYLVGAGYGSEVLAAHATALDATNSASGAWRQLHGLLVAAGTVTEAYGAVPHAGNKQAHTNE